MAGFFSPSGGGFFSPSNGSLTTDQALALAYANASPKHNSFLHDVLSGTGSALGTTLSYLSRPAQAIASAEVEGTKAGDKWNLKTFSALGKGFYAGLTNKEHATFSDYLRLKYPHFAANHKVATAVAGLGLDVITDPTLPLIVASNLIPGVGEGADATLAARLSADLGRGKNAVENYHKALDANKALQGMGDEFTHRKALAALESHVANVEIHGGDVSERDLDLLAMLRDAAKREAEANGRRVFQAKYSIPFSGGKSIPLTPAYIAGRRVAPLTPKLARTAAGEGAIAKIPGLAPLASGVGHVFRHGFNSEEFSKPSLMAAKQSDQKVEKYLRRARNLVFAPHQDLSVEQMQKALDWGETHKDVVAGPNRVLDEKALAASPLSDSERSFVKAWHEHMNFLDAKNKEFGVKYEEELGNKVYVPHMFDRKGGVVSLSALKAKFGPGLRRESQLSLKQLAESNVAKGLNLETDPMNLLFHYSTQIAKHQAQSTLLDFERASAGVVERVPNEAKNARVAAAIAAYEKKMEEVPLLGNVRGRRISMTKQVNSWTKKRTTIAFARAQARMAPHHQLSFLHSVADWAEAPKNVPSFSNALKIGSKTMKESVAHLPEADRRALVTTHALLHRHRRLSSQIAQYAGKRGGPVAGLRSTAEEVGRFKADVGRLTGAAQGDTKNLSKQFAPAARGESWHKNLQRELDAQLHNLRSHYGELKDKYPTTPNVNHLGQAQHHQKMVDKIAGQLAKDVERIHEQAKMRRAKAELQFEEDYTKHEATYNRLLKKRDYAISRLGTHYMTNPNIPEGWMLLDRVISGEKYYFPPEMHAAMTRMEKMYTNDTTIQEFETMGRKLLSSWKLGVTSINPGYRVRNTVSDLWNMYVSGVPIPRIAQYGAKAATFQLRVKEAAERLANGQELTKGHRQALRQLQEMDSHGILSGLFQGDVQRGAQALRSGRKWRDIAGLSPRAAGATYLQFAQDINRNTENWGRITHYLYRREYQHLSPVDAADWVKKAHFDYTELTPIEQQKFKVLAPFYTWTRKDIPFQLQALFSRPGKYATYAKVARTSNELATGDPNTPDDQPNTLPGFIRDNFGFRVPGFGSEGYYVPNIGVQDLSKVTHPKSLLSLANPLITTAYEASTGINAFTGQPIQGPHPRNPISGLGADLLRHVPGANVGPTARNVRGEKETGVGASPWATFIAGQLPLTNFAINQTSNIRRDQRGGGGLSALNYLGGFSVYNRDLPTEAISANLSFEDKMKRVMRGLRDEGLIPESKKGNSAYQQTLQGILNG